MTPEAQDQSPLAQCRQCGTCCRKGGPALHGEDRALVENGQLPLAALVTLRQGQRVQDNVSGELIHLSTDVIKIKSAAGKATCRFLTPANDCSIYAQRPRECRLLQCWNTAALIREYRRNRLTRHDLMGGIPELWDLLQNHQTRCAYDRIYTLLKALRTQTESSPEFAELGEIISYDKHLRVLIARKAPQFKEQMDFLLGQPLTASLAQLGLRISATPTGWRIRDLARDSAT